MAMTTAAATATIAGTLLLADDPSGWALSCVAAGSLLMTVPSGVVLLATGVSPLLVSVLEESPLEEAAEVELVSESVDELLDDSVEDVDDVENVDEVVLETPVEMGVDPEHWDTAKLVKTTGRDPASLHATGPAPTPAPNSLPEDPPAKAADMPGTL